MEVLNLALSNPVTKGSLTSDVQGTHEFCSHQATRNCIVLIPAILLLKPLYKSRGAFEKNKHTTHQPQSSQFPKLMSFQCQPSLHSSKDVTSHVLKQTCPNYILKL